MTWALNWRTPARVSGWMAMNGALPLWGIGWAQQINRAGHAGSLHETAGLRRWKGHSLAWRRRPSRQPNNTGKLSSQATQCLVLFLESCNRKYLDAISTCLSAFCQALLVARFFAAADVTWRLRRCWQDTPREQWHAQTDWKLRALAAKQ